MITDVFSSAAVSPWELRWQENPRDRLPCFPADSIGPREMSQLAELLGVGSYEEVIRGFSLLAGESQESPWVVSIPDALILKLSSVDEDEARAIAQHWARSEAFQGRVVPKDLGDYLIGLAGFLREHRGPFVLYVAGESAS